MHFDQSTYMSEMQHTVRRLNFVYLTILCQLRSMIMTYEQGRMWNVSYLFTYTSYYDITLLAEIYCVD